MIRKVYKSETFISTKFTIFAVNLICRQIDNSKMNSQKFAALGRGLLGLFRK